MKTSDYLKLFMCDLLYSLCNAFDDCFKKHKEPSYLAYNVAWFTNCSWLEQLQAFKQLDNYLDYGKTHV
jgi:hypothetical protein